jgi:hypothetical protein
MDKILSFRSDCRQWQILKNWPCECGIHIQYFLYQRLILSVKYWHALYHPIKQTTNLGRRLVQGQIIIL